MKKGCLFLIVVWAGLGFYWYQRLQTSPLADKAWIGILLGLSTALVFANLMGIFMAVRQKRASSRTAAEWSEGDLICVSGRISAVGKPVVAPFSGKFCSMVEYELKRGTGDEDSPSIPEFRGMLMAPSMIQTMRGSVKVVGFPLFTAVNMRLVDDGGVYKRAAEYLLATQFKDNPKNPLKMLKELTDVLGDNDGEIKADFKQPGISIDDIAFHGGSGAAGLYDPDEDFDEDEDDGAEGEERPVAAGPAAGAGGGEPPLDRVSQIAAGLANDGYSFRETAVESGTEVTLFGTYRAQTQAVDISGGLGNLSHQFHFGQVEAVVGKQLRNSILASIFWVAVCAGAHYFVLEAIGYDVLGLLKGSGLL